MKILNWLKNLNYKLQNFFYGEILFISEDCGFTVIKRNNFKSKKRFDRCAKN